MAVFKQRIKNLIGGVSQQTPELRLANQCTEQINCWNDIVTGMRKRPNTVSIGEVALNGSPDETRFHTHVISDTERYLIAVSKSGLQVFNALSGEEYEVDDADVGTYITDGGDYKMMTVGDDVFVLNTGKEVSMYPYTPAVSLPPDEKYMKKTWTFSQADWDSGYFIYINGNKVPTKLGVTVRPPNHAPLRYSPVTDAALLEYELNKTYPLEDFKREGATVIWEGTSSTHIDVKTDQPQWLKVTSKEIDYEVRERTTGLAYIVQPDYEVTYSLQLTVDGVSQPVVEYTTPKSTASGARAKVTTEYILNQLTIGINAETSTHGLIARLFSKNCLYVYTTRDDIDRWTMQADDDLDGSAFISFRNTLSKESDLPPDAPPGYYVEITGTDSSDSYYLQYIVTEAGDGYWKETVKPEIATKLNETTMPHLLVRSYDESNQKITFTLGRYNWAEREAGDPDTAPTPSFVGRRINAMSLLRGRLVFASGNDVVMSEVNAANNFWPTSTITVIESDPVDISLDSPQALKIEAITSDNEVLLLWDNSVQMGLQHDGNSWIANEVSAYNVHPQATPTRIGSTTYHAGYEGGRTQVGSYYRVRDQLYESTDVTSHTPTYIQLEPRYITGNSVDSYMAVCSSGSAEVYVYNFRQQGQDLVQSAWSKWIVGNGVYYINDTNGELQLLVERQDGKLYLESMDLQSSTPVLMDSLVVSDSLPPSEPNKKTVRYGGKWYTGYNYEQTYTFSPIYFRYNNETQTDAPLMLRKLELDYEGTVGFDVSVTNRGNTKTKSLRMLKGLPYLLNGDVEHKRGVFSMLTRGNTDNITIQLTNEEPYECNIVAAKWTGSYHKRTR